jgi:hypothetical protein
MQANKPKTKIITGCNDCPFVYYDINKAKFFWPHCGARDHENELETASLDIIKTPTWCPLKTQPIIITYES